MFKELKTGKCLGAEKGEMPSRGAVSQSVRACVLVKLSTVQVCLYTMDGQTRSQSACRSRASPPQGSFCLGNCLSDESSQDPSPPLCCDEFWAEVRFQLGSIIFFLALLCGSCAQLTFLSSFPWWALLSRRAVNEARASCGDHLQGSQGTWLSQCQTVSC